MDIGKISIEYVSEYNKVQLLKIQRDDIPEDFVDSVSTILEIMQYGIDNDCIGHAFAIKYEEVHIGIVILGGRCVYFVLGIPEG